MRSVIGCSVLPVPTLKLTCSRKRIGDPAPKNRNRNPLAERWQRGQPSTLVDPVERAGPPDSPDYTQLSRPRRILRAGRRCYRWSRAAALGRGCVKTCTSEERAALFSLLSFPRSGRQCFYFSDWRNRERFSTRSLRARVFTQARSTAVHPLSWGNRQQWVVSGHSSMPDQTARPCRELSFVDFR